MRGSSTYQFYNVACTLRPSDKQIDEEQAWVWKCEAKLKGERWTYNWIGNQEDRIKQDRTGANKIVKTKRYRQNRGKNSCEREKSRRITKWYATIAQTFSFGFFFAIPCVISIVDAFWHIAIALYHGQSKKPIYLVASRFPRRFAYVILGSGARPKYGFSIL